MERPNLSAIGKIIKEKWNCTDFMMSASNPCEIPWAVKNYSCNFCKRQFKSAQALGGHMNVHRRERARLRLFSPLSTVAESCYNPSPNKFSSLSSSPSLSSSSATLSAKFLPQHYASHSMLSPPTASLSLPDHPLASTEKDRKTIFDFPRSCSSAVPLRDTTTKSMKAPVFEDGDLEGRFSQKADYFKAFKTENVNITFDLETGLLKDQNEGVDLELRLGYF
ncbi:Transcriptional regulator SUPERMAN [Morus notabilis]|uniref:Transcriptional regulator SUPERMAN n=1 Tax=Morus notabilis TaxID=981085 RepID=W9SXL4_9ROSA|nr:transcriptional regulator SUPERMAN [Morus notabilis]EXC31922.1 Transcriptional regulator SUPERMAN [Morus notabilis]